MPMSTVINQSVTEMTSPVWAGDFMSRDHLVPGPFHVVASQFIAPDGVRVTVDTAGAAANATAVPVTALSGAIPSGTLLDFGGKKFARLSAAAAAGATSLTVDALATALVAADVATYAGTKKKSIRDGTAVGRTYAERDAGTGMGPAAATDDEVFLLAFEITDADVDNGAVMYRPNAQVKENRLPDWAGLASGVKDKVRARYLCTLGAE